MMATRISHYRIERELGRGAAGIVYEAVDELLNRPVALKVIRADANEGARTTNPGELLREAQVIARLSHPSLVTVYGFETHGTTALIAMELLVGDSLADRLRDGHRFSVAQACSLVSQVAGGLAVAHEAGIIHRDVKPANVMLPRGGGVKLLDFGVALMSTETREGAGLAGTPGYSAPEQYRWTNLTTSADVYGLAAMLLELLVGERPFAGQDSASIAALAQAGPPPQLGQLLSTVRIAPALASLLRDSLSPDAALRPESASEFRDRLEALNTASGAKPRIRRTRNRTVLVVAALTIIAIAGAAATSLSLGADRRYVARQPAADTAALDESAGSSTPSSSSEVTEVDPSDSAQEPPVAVSTPIADEFRGRSSASPEPPATAGLHEGGTTTVAAALPVRSASPPSEAPSGQRPSAPPNRQEPRLIPAKVQAPPSDASGDTRPSPTASAASAAPSSSSSAASASDQVAQPNAWPGMLKVREGSCAGRELVIDAVLVGELPVSYRDVGSGTHRIMVRNPVTKATEWSSTVRIAPGGDLAVTPTCAPN